MTLTTTLNAIRDDPASERNHQADICRAWLNQWEASQ